LGAVAGVVTDVLCEVGFRRFEMWFLNCKIGQLVFCTPGSPNVFLACDANKLLKSHEFLQFCLHNISPLSNIVFSEGILGLG
jgi:hypothetical protein